LLSTCGQRRATTEVAQMAFAEDYDMIPDVP
jgi:hypothetical protein